MFQKSRSNALIATATAFCVAFTQVAFAAPALTATTPEVSLPSTLLVDQAAAFSVPSAVASVEKYLPGSGKTVFHIQTAHGNYQAEKNIESLLAHLEKNYGVETLLVEGASNPLNPEIINFFPEDRKSTLEAVDAFVRHAVVSGSEVFLLNSGKAQGLGIEDEKSYEQNLQDFAAVIKARDESSQFLSDLDRGIERLSAIYASSDLRSFTSRVEKKETGDLPFDAYLQEIKTAALKYLELDLSDASWQVIWPQLTRVFTIEKIEKKIDATAFKKQKEGFLKAIKPYAAGELADEVEKLLNLKDLSVRLPDPDTSIIFEKLVQVLPANFDYDRFSSVTAYAGILMLKSQVRAEGLAAEIMHLEDKIADKLADTKNAKNLVAVLKDYRLLKKLFALELMPADFEMIATGSVPSEARGLTPMVTDVRPSRLVNRLTQINGVARAKEVVFGNVSELDALYQKAVRFYEGARLRDEKMLARVEERLAETGADKVAVVTGGFHSEPFAKYFEKRGYSYALMTPKITDMDIQGRQHYLDVMQMWAAAPRGLSSSSAETATRGSVESATLEKPASTGLGLLGRQFLAKAASRFLRPALATLIVANTFTPLTAPAADVNVGGLSSVAQQTGTVPDAPKEFKVTNAMLKQLEADVRAGEKSLAGKGVKAQTVEAWVKIALDPAQEESLRHETLRLAGDKTILRIEGGRKSANSMGDLRAASRLFDQPSFEQTGLIGDALRAEKTLLREWGALNDDVAYQQALKNWLGGNGSKPALRDQLKTATRQEARQRSESRNVIKTAILTISLLGLLALPAGAAQTVFEILGVTYNKTNGTVSAVYRGENPAEKTNSVQVANQRVQGTTNLVTKLFSDVTTPVPGAIVLNPGDQFVAIQNGLPTTGNFSAYRLAADEEIVSVSTPALRTAFVFSASGVKRLSRKEIIQYAAPEMRGQIEALGDVSIYLFDGNGEVTAVYQPAKTRAEARSASSGQARSESRAKTILSVAVAGILGVSIVGGMVIGLNGLAEKRMESAKRSVQGMEEQVAKTLDISAEQGASFLPFVMLGFEEYRRNNPNADLELYLQSNKEVMGWFWQDGNEEAREELYEIYKKREEARSRSEARDYVVAAILENLRIGTWSLRPDVSVPDNQEREQELSVEGGRIISEKVPEEPLEFVLEKKGAVSTDSLKKLFPIVEKKLKEIIADTFQDDSNVYFLLQTQWKREGYKPRGLESGLNLKGWAQRSLNEKILTLLAVMNSIEDAVTEHLERLRIESQPNPASIPVDVFTQMVGVASVMAGEQIRIHKIDNADDVIEGKLVRIKDNSLVYKDDLAGGAEKNISLDSVKAVGISSQDSPDSYLAKISFSIPDARSEARNLDQAEERLNQLLQAKVEGKNDDLVTGDLRMSIERLVSAARGDEDTFYRQLASVITEVEEAREAPGQATNSVLMTVHRQLTLIASASLARRSEARLTEEQRQALGEAVRVFGLSPENEAYMIAMMLQSGKQPLKIRIGDNGGNYILAGALTPEQRAQFLGAVPYAEIKGNAQYLDAAKKTAAIIYSLDGGLGEKLVRSKFKATLVERGLLKESDVERDEAGVVKIGAKGPDTGFIVNIQGQDVFLSIAEAKLLQMIHFVDNGTFGTLGIQPLVNKDSLPSYQKLFERPYLFDRLEGKATVRTYRQVLEEKGIEIREPFLQQDVPGIDVEKNIPATTKQGTAQPGGHGQLGFGFFYNPEAWQPRADGLVDILVFTNGDNLNSSNLSPEIIGMMLVDKKPVVKLTTRATPIDKKGGKDGVEVVEKDGQVIAYIPQQLEIADAQANKQEPPFIAAGQESGAELFGPGSVGNQPFNTNTIIVAKDLLFPMLAKLKSVLGADRYYAEVIAPSLIPKDAKTGKDGRSYRPVDGAIGTVIHNLNEFVMRSLLKEKLGDQLDEKDRAIISIIREAGYEKILYFVDVPREFFTPQKNPFDAYMQYVIKDGGYYGLNTTTFTFTEQKEGLVPPLVDIKDSEGRAFDSGKGRYAELQNMIETFGDEANIQGLKELRVAGDVVLINATLRGTVLIRNASKQVVDLNAIPELPRKDGRLDLTEIEVVIDEAGNVSSRSLRSEQREGEKELLPLPVEWKQALETNPNLLNRPEYGFLKNYDLSDVKSLRSESRLPDPLRVELGKSPKIEKSDIYGSRYAMHHVKPSEDMNRELVRIRQWIEALVPSGPGVNARQVNYVLGLIFNQPIEESSAIAGKPAKNERIAFFTDQNNRLVGVGRVDVKMPRREVIRSLVLIGDELDPALQSRYAIGTAKSFKAQLPEQALLFRPEIQGQLTTGFEILPARSEYREGAQVEPVRVNDTFGLGNQQKDPVHKNKYEVSVWVKKINPDVNAGSVHLQIDKNASERFVDLPFGVVVDPKTINPAEDLSSYFPGVQSLVANRDDTDGAVSITFNMEAGKTVTRTSSGLAPARVSQVAAGAVESQPTSAAVSEVPSSELTAGRSELRRISYAEIPSELNTAIEALGADRDDVVVQVFELGGSSIPTFKRDKVRLLGGKVVPVNLGELVQSALTAERNTSNFTVERIADNESGNPVIEVREMSAVGRSQRSEQRLNLDLQGVNRLQPLANVLQAAFLKQGFSTVRDVFASLGNPNSVDLILGVPSAKNPEMKIYLRPTDSLISVQNRVLRFFTDDSSRALYYGFSSKSVDISKVGWLTSVAVEPSNVVLRADTESQLIVVEGGDVQRSEARPALTKEQAIVILEKFTQGILPYNKLVEKLNNNIEASVLRVALEVVGINLRLEGVDSESVDGLLTQLFPDGGEAGLRINANVIRSRPIEQSATVTAKGRVVQTADTVLRAIKDAPRSVVENLQALADGEYLDIAVKDGSEKSTYDAIKAFLASGSAKVPEDAERARLLAKVKLHKQSALAQFVADQKGVAVAFILTGHNDAMFDQVTSDNVFRFKLADSKRPLAGKAFWTVPVVDVATKKVMANISGQQRGQAMSQIPLLFQGLDLNVIVNEDGSFGFGAIATLLQAIVAAKYIEVMA